ncbi:AAA family ATPase [bacterium]|nr:AAA family ATPase [bacterium]
MDKNLPVLLLKKLSLLPTQEVRLELNNELSQHVIEVANTKFDKKVVVILPKNSLEESLGVNDLPEVGVLAQIKSCVVLPNSNYRVVLKGLNRVKIKDYTNYAANKSILIASTHLIYIDNGETVEEYALKKKLISLLNKYITSSTEISNSILSKIKETDSLDALTDIIVNFMHFPIEKKLLYMNEFDECTRAKMLIKDINVELEIITLNNKIDNELRTSFEQEQKEYLIKAKIEKLNEELGIKSSKEQEIASYTESINSLKLNEKSKKKLMQELKRYEYTPNNNPELSVIRNYLETVLSLPYNVSSKEETKADKISKALDKTHYKMDNVKKRIIEYALLKAKNPSLDNPVLCLIGSPGVGKSTIAKSIAEALKREFYKISVGGLNDSSELTGHRRTYLGAAPGKIIEAILKCGTNNPVILIDEVDKMVKDYKGDPASVLLDILDNNQNKEFIDNYIEEPFDLSKVLFILTANDVNEIPAVLRDRLEIINISNYTSLDKKDIAINYLIPNICTKYNAKKLTISEEIVNKIIKEYTLEPGVRELERLLDNVIRHMIINDIKEEPNIVEILGMPIISYENKTNLVGQANIIGVSPLGGALIKVSSIMVPMTYDTNITGNVGDELRDSIKIVMSYFKSNGYMDYKKSTNGIHINFDTHRFKLDGSSGSLGIAMSLASLIHNKPIDSNIAFLGSLDLYGRINKVSKLREKVITAYNNNITQLFIPIDNKIDEPTLPIEILKEINIMYISSFEEIYKIIFKK